MGRQNTVNTDFVPEVSCRKQRLLPLRACSKVRLEQAWWAPLFRFISKFENLFSNVLFSGRQDIWDRCLRKIELIVLASAADIEKVCGVRKKKLGANTANRRACHQR